MKHFFSPAARDDLRNAVAFYETQQEGLGLELAVEVGMGIAAIRESPARWPELDKGVRKFRIARFPYALLYRIASRHSIQIIAFFDLRRKPDSWRR